LLTFGRKTERRSTGHTSRMERPSAPKPIASASFHPATTPHAQSDSTPRLYRLPVPARKALVTMRKKPRSPHGSPQLLRTILRRRAGEGG
jgi:hypothetical protein